MKTRRTIKRAVANRIGTREKTVANRMARAAGLSSEVMGELVKALDTPDDIRAAIFRLAGRVAPPKKAVAHIPVFPEAMPLENGVLYMLRHPNAARLLGAGSMETYERHWRTLTLAHFAAVYQGNRDHPEWQHILREREKSPASTPPTKAQRNGSGNTATSP